MQTVDMMLENASMVCSPVVALLPSPQFKMIKQQWGSFIVISLLFLIGDSIAEEVSTECGIYFAPSTIPGAGNGMFTGRSFQEGEEVTPGDIAVPAVDIKWHNANHGISWLWGDYEWNPSGFPGMEEEGSNVFAISFGIGAAPNCFFPMINVEESYTQMDSAGLHRGTDRGAGAITPYHDRRSHAIRSIRAGEEIFVDYGNSYFRSREYLLGPIPLTDDYEQADKLLQTYTDINKRTKSRAARSQQCLEGEGDSCHVPDLSGLSQDLFRLVKSFSSAWPSPILRAIPDDPVVADKAAKAGSSNIFWNHTVRDLEWLKENGSCMDNIRPGNSTIEQAGRGAFAARPIREGDILSPVPLVHVASRSILTMYEGIYNFRGNFVRDASAPSHYQLLLNYCFGHRSSSLLLCPYGVVTALINHSKEKANARIAWSSKSSQHLDWLEKPLEEWVNTNVAGLAFDYIATRDIKEGEEIFIDYSDEWEAAWQRHTETGKPFPRTDPCETDHELDPAVDLVIRTVDEGPYHACQMKLLCRGYYSLLYEERESVNCRAIQRFDGPDGEPHYMAKVYEAFDDEEAGTCREKLQEILWNVPRDAFCLEDYLCTRDHAHPWSFRHDMRIPDDIMPRAWMDLL